MSSEKFYFICKRFKSNFIEVVHPRQIRKSDKILFEANSEEWWEFDSILREHNMDSRQIHYKKLEDLWNRYYRWMSSGYPAKSAIQ